MNKFGLTNQEALDRAEANSVLVRSTLLQLNPLGGNFDSEHLKQWHLFRDVYDWAGGTLGPLSWPRKRNTVLRAMVRLILVVILGCVLDHEDRLVGGGNSFRYWFVIAAMVGVSIYVS